jgi:hypothetical protein
MKENIPRDGLAEIAVFEVVYGFLHLQSASHLQII